MIPARWLIAATLTLALVAPTAASAAAGTASPAHRAPARAVQHVSITIMAGDRVVEPNLALAAGVPVRLAIRNFTHQFHSFTVPALGLSALVSPARGRAPVTTVVRFTPTRAGTLAWGCVICPSGEHGHPHTMSGKIYVIIDPAVFG